MCGFAGTLVRDGLTDADLDELDALGALMQRRGPDDTGSWDDGRNCALTFRRLAIIDLSSGGHQPMATEDGRDVLVFNGELYNFRELRSELEAHGHRFRSTSDSEVVLRSLVHWGTAALARFNGMFALAWYRTDTRSVVLARDPIGIKPLFWWWSPEALVFGSQYDQVIRHRRCRRDRVDPSVVHLFLRLSHLPAPYGLIDGTGQVRPGHFLEVTPGGRPVERRFAPDLVAGPDRLAGPDADRAVHDAVAAAVERQSVSDVRMGCFLSGGVDSPLVASLMEPRGGGAVPAFTIGTDDPVTDETDAAVAFGREFGLEHHVRRISADRVLTMIGEFAAAYPDPFADYSAFPTMLVSALAREHVKVVQSGDGGDELFWGYPRFAKVRGSRPWFRWPRAARVAAYAATKPLPVGRRPPRGVMFATIGDWYLDAHSGLRGRDFRRIAPGLAPLPDDFTTFDLASVPDDDGLLQWMRHNELTVHLPMVLAKVDRASMYHSLEVRVPLLDLEVAALAHRVDPSACLEGGLGKKVLRHALERAIPADRIPVAKKGFTIPLGSWLRVELRDLASSLLVERDPFPHGMFDRQALAAFLDDHVSGRLDLTRGLWNLLALQLWADAHLRPLEHP